MLRVVAVNYGLRGEGVTRISFKGISTFLDADVLLVAPRQLPLHYSAPIALSDGTLYLSLARGARSLRRDMKRRREEVGTLLKNGKLVVVFLSPRVALLAENFEAEDSVVSNYDWLPKELAGITTLMREGVGSSLVLKSPRHPFAPYYEAFSSNLSYEAYFHTTKQDPNEFFLTNKTGNPVAWFRPVRNGYMVFLPPPPDDAAPEKVLGVLRQCARTTLGGGVRTPEPAWTREFELGGESQLLAEIKAVRKELNKRVRETERLDRKRRSLADYRQLLYEQGKPLEAVVIRALGLLGFEAEPFQKGDMEHDVVLQSPEGRAVAEVEGRDGAAIAIGKLDQLGRVVDEDFKEHNVYSHGLLIGNPYRLTPPDERGEPFTEKVQLAAKRKDFALLTTVELFGAVQRVLEHPEDKGLKEACRRAILETKGEHVRFPGSQR